MMPRSLLAFSYVSVPLVAVLFQVLLMLAGGARAVPMHAYFTPAPWYLRNGTMDASPYSRFCSIDTMLLIPGCWRRPATTVSDGCAKEVATILVPLHQDSPAPHTIPNRREELPAPADTAAVEEDTDRPISQKALTWLTITATTSVFFFVGMLLVYGLYLYDHRRMQRQNASLQEDLELALTQASTDREQQAPQRNVLAQAVASDDVTWNQNLRSAGQNVTPDRPPTYQAAAVAATIAPGSSRHIARSSSVGAAIPPTFPTLATRQVK